MKKIYLLIFILLSSLSVIYPLVNKIQNLEKNEENLDNNLKNIIYDSIPPSCIQNKVGFSENPDIKIEQLEIRIPKSKEWSKNLIQAYIFSPDKLIIDDRFKKRFKGEVIVTSMGKKCFLPARIRIHGDSFDHLKLTPEGVYSSLDISLKKGNINGVVNFKLFIPKTRNGDSEIITTSFMKSLGFLSPRTNFVDVKINESSKTKMILQEKIGKEMIENFSLRESALIGINEKLMWKSRSKKDGDFTSYIYPKSKNIKWVRRGESNKKITIKGLNILSNALNESWEPNIDKEKSFSDFILSNGYESKKSDLSKFRVYLIAMGAEHALHNNNRRFYFEPLKNYLIPIYYDGNSLIKEYSQKKYGMNLDYINSFRFLREVTKEDILSAIQDIEKIDIVYLKNDIERRGIKISNNEVINIKSEILKNIKIILNNLEDLEENQNNSKLNFKKDFSKRIINSNNYGLAFNNYKNNFELCFKYICKNIDLQNYEIIELMNNGLYKDEVLYLYNGPKKFDQTFKSHKNFDISSRNRLKIGKLDIYTIGNPKVFIDESQKILRAEINHKNQKLIIQDSDLSNWQLNVNGPLQKSIENNESRFDERLLTAMVTIKDSYFNNLKIDIKNGVLEDSLNIISSKGNISKINIANSFQDAIDFDFSNIIVNDIKVTNSGNDCLDLSSGIYLIKKININSCLDKGVSVGEKSKVKIKDFFIRKTSIAFAVKDSSDLIIENGYLDNYEICATAYRKKQEFGSAFIQANKGICNKNEFLIQNNSLIKFI